MANEFEKAGSQGKPTRYRPLFTNRFFSGLWTQRNPLRDAATPYIYEKFYGSRFDALIDGSNVELTNKLTLQRRPGLTVYNSQTFPPINTFYSFRETIANVESIKVLADTATDVFDATGPSTKTSIFTKGVGAGQTSFLSVGNNLFMGDGIETAKWDGTTISSFGIKSPANAPADSPLAYLGAPCRYWGPNMKVVPGYAILDSNGNVQLMTGAVNSANNLSQTIKPAVLNNGGTVPGDYEGGVDQGHNPIATGSAGAYNNPTSAFDGNPATASDIIVQHSHAYKGCTWKFSYGATANITKLTLNVLSGISAPILTARDAGIWYSVDNGTTWTKVYQSNTRSTQWDKISLSVTDPNLVQVLAFMDAHDDMGHQVYEINLVVDLTLVSVVLGTTAQTTGTKVPLWNTSLYGNTTDGTAVWLNCGPISQWQANTSYNTEGPSGAIIDTNGNLQIVENTGASGPAQPTWATAPGSTTTDGTVTWYNCGPGNTVAFQGWKYVYAFHTTSGNASTASPVSQPTGPVLGTIAIPLSGDGSADPTCDYVYIFRTLDGGASYLFDDKVANPGVSTIPAVQSSLIAQAIDFVATTAGVAGNNVTIQLVSVGTADATAITTTGDVVVVDIKKVDTTIRTVSDIAALFTTYGPTRANTTSGGVITATSTAATPAVIMAATNLTGGAASVITPNTWTFTDTHPDTDLNEFILAAISHTNDVPPDGLISLTFHLGRIWGSVGNTVYYSRVADATVGNGLEDFPPNNYLVFPSKVTKLYANGMGLLVFTISDIYLVLWSGTSTSILQVIPFSQGIGLLSPNAFDVNGSLVYMHTSDGQIVAFDPNAGVSEVGFPIGDQITWSPSSTYIAWHVNGSADKGLFVADGSTGWFRCNPVSAPETGLSWSPKATITGSCKVVQSIEVSPGAKRLLVSGTGSGPILQRDITAFSDNGTTYAANATIGSVTLANPGQMAELKFVAADSAAVGTRPTLRVRLDEITGAFQTLSNHVPDPPKLAESSTIFGNRYYFSQTQAPAWCRHMQLDILWASEAAKSELLTYTIFGATWNE